MAVIEILLILSVPALVLFLMQRFKFISKIGAVTICYIIGLILAVLPIEYDKNLSQTVASVIVAIALPLILFSLDILSVRKLAGKTLLSFALVILSVITVSTTAALIAVHCGVLNAPSLAGMATGLYIGGTPNLFAIGSALLNDINIINIANVSDSIIGGIYILLAFTVVKKLYKLLPGRSHSAVGISEQTDYTAVQNEYDYREIPGDKKSLLKIARNILLALVCLGIGVLIEILVNGNMDGSLYIIITVSVLGIALSFIKPVREVKGTYQVGQYLILVFSLGLSMSIDLEKIVSDILPIFLFFASVQMGAIILHYVLCLIFRIDGGTAIITSIAGIYGPPFIAPAANAYGDQKLIIPGVICGTLGLVLGNVIGIALGEILATIL